MDKKDEDFCVLVDDLLFKVQKYPDEDNDIMKNHELLRNLYWLLYQPDKINFEPSKYKKEILMPSFASRK